MGRFCIPALDGFFFLPFSIIKRLLLQPQQQNTTYKRRQFVVSICDRDLRDTSCLLQNVRHLIPYFKFLVRYQIIKLLWLHY